MPTFTFARSLTNKTSKLVIKPSYSSFRLLIIFVGIRTFSVWFITSVMMSVGWIFARERNICPSPIKNLTFESKTHESTSVSVCSRGISRLPSAFVFLRRFKLAHISIQACALSTMGVSKESISKILIGNRFQKLPILSPENCKQSLQVKS